MVSSMGTVFIRKNQRIYTKVNGKMIKSMEKESTFMLTGTNSRGHGQKI